MRFLLFVFLFSWAAVAFAEDSNVNSNANIQSALAAAQQVIVDPQAREKAAAGNSQATEAIKQIGQVVGSKEDENRVYELTSQIMGELVKKNGGNTAKMQEILQKASQDPTSFLQGLTSQEQKEISDIASKSPLMNGKSLP